MAGLTDILSTIQNGVVAFNNLTTHMEGSFNNISGQIATKIATVSVQKFTGSGTYTPTSGMVYCIIECVGGGGGGGGTGAAGATTLIIGAGGGGSGGYSRLMASAATIGASKIVTVGALGGGGSAGANAGTAGG